MFARGSLVLARTVWVGREQISTAQLQIRANLCVSACQFILGLVCVYRRSAYGGDRSYYMFEWPSLEPSKRPKNLNTLASSPLARRSSTQIQAHCVNCRF
jgi:hypothetical protein